MAELKSKLTYSIPEFQQNDEDELGFIKGCFSGVLLGIPLWVIIIVIIKLIIAK